MQIRPVLNRPNTHEAEQKMAAGARVVNTVWLYKPVRSTTHTHTVSAKILTGPTCPG